MFSLLLVYQVEWDTNPLIRPRNGVISVSDFILIPPPQENRLSEAHICPNLNVLHETSVLSYIWITKHFRYLKNDLKSSTAKHYSEYNDVFTQKGTKGSFISIMVLP